MFRREARWQVVEDLEAEGEAAAPGAAAEPEVLTAKKDKEGDAAAPGAKAAAPAKEAKKG